MNVLDSLRSILATPGWSWAGFSSGAMAAIGVGVFVRGLPFMRRHTYIDRIEPYLRDAPRPSRLLARSATAQQRGWFGELTAPLMARSADRLERLLGGGPSIQRRLLRAGLDDDVDRFRAQQVLWGVGGALAGLASVAFIAATRGAIAVFPSVALVISSALTGVVAKDSMLTRSAKRREDRMLVEFPTVAELLALAVSAGESATGALERVVRLSRGELSDELRWCLADAHAGANLPTALQGLADRTGLPSLARFVDGIVIAVERGTPLADVLRAQAQDVREQSRRNLLEEGGRKEIQMMVPVVFLILPVTILFAIFPGAEFLNFTV